MISIIVAGAAGRMGTTILRLAAEEGIAVAGLLDRPEQMSRLEQSCVAANLSDYVLSSDPATVFQGAPGAVIIDFTAPDASIRNARLAVETGNPLVIGTTGLTAEDKAELAVLAERVPLVWSPSMSVGVNVLLDILPRLARMLGPDYDLEMLELHHNRKLDAPSGTALRLAESMAEGRDWKLDDVARYARHGIVGARPEEEIGMQAVRGGDVAGVHTAYFMGQGERIEVTHHAHSRDNFARGALRAALWLEGKPAGRLYSMQDVLEAVC